jgi:hypothetical protein
MGDLTHSGDVDAYDAGQRSAEFEPDQMTAFDPDAI